MMEGAAGGQASGGAQSNVAYDVSLQIAAASHRQRLEQLFSLEQAVSDHQLTLPPPDHATAPVGHTSGCSAEGEMLAVELKRFASKQEQALGLLAEVKTEQLSQRLLLVRLLALVQASSSDLHSTSGAADLAPETLDLAGEDARRDVEQAGGGDLLPCGTRLESC